MTKRDGACLCGAVRIAGDFDDTLQACHCGMCQTWTGGGPLYAVRVKGDLQITGLEATQSYCASKWGERVFCGTCGANLWWKMQGKPVSFVAPGLFAGQGGLTLSEEIFVDHRAAWMAEAPGASQSTEADEKAKLEAYLKGQNT